MYLRQLRAQAFHSEGEVVTQFPPNQELQIATVAPQGMKLILIGIGTSKPTQQMAQMPWTTQMEKTTLGMEWKLILWCKGSIPKIREAITKGNVLAVSDRSFQNQCSMCAWIIKGDHSVDWIKGSMITPG